MATPMRSVDGPAADMTFTLALEHPDWGPAQVHREIEAKLGPDRIPSLRTVQRQLKDFRRSDESGRWSMAHGGPEDSALVLEVVRSLIDESASPWQTWPRWPTRDVGDWIVRIRRAFPDLDDRTLTFYLAALANRGGEYLERVETYLAYAPWRDGCEALFRAIDRGVVGANVVWGFGHGDEYVRWQTPRVLSDRDRPIGPAPT